MLFHSARGKSIVISRKLDWEVRPEFLEKGLVLLFFHSARGKSIIVSREIYWDFGEGGENRPEVLGIAESHGSEGFHIFIGPHHGEDGGGNRSVRLVESVDLLGESVVPVVSDHAEFRVAGSSQQSGKVVSLKNDSVGNRLGWVGGGELLSEVRDSKVRGLGLGSSINGVTSEGNNGNRENSYGKDLYAVVRH